jgi:hypothetical protein
MDKLTIRTYHKGMDKEKFNSLSELIFSNRLLVPGFEFENEEEIYDISSYLKDRDEFGTDICLLADRNLMTRWIALYRGGNVKNDNDRLASGVLAFAQLAEMVIEPNISLYEFAMTNSNEKANQELNEFRNADELNPYYWTLIALEKSDSLPVNKLEHINKKHSINIDFKMPIQRWRNLYVLVLKIAEIELHQKGNSYKQISKLFKWMYEDYMMLSTAIILAIHYFAPNNKRKGLLKSLRSKDRERAINGIKNATWDLMIMLEWTKKIQVQDKNNEQWVLCSLDNKLRIFAKSLVYLNGDENPIEATILKLFPLSIATTRLIEEFRIYMSTLDSPDRIYNQSNKQENISNLIRKGEKIICEWSQ